MGLAPLGVGNNANGSKPQCESVVRAPTSTVIPPMEIGEMTGCRRATLPVCGRSVLDVGGIEYLESAHRKR